MKLLCLLLIASCSSYFPPIRGQYTLSTLKHFMISNMYVNPSNLLKENGQILIQYDVIVKNIDQKPHKINLKDSSIRFNEKKFPMNCSRFLQKDQQFDLKNEEQTRIVCLGKVEKIQGSKSDYRSIIEIPLDQDIAKFDYLLRAEDFE